MNENNDLKKTMKSIKLVNLADRDEDAKRLTPADLLKSVLKEYEDGEIEGTKIMIVCLDDTQDNDYRVYRRMGGIHGNEARSLLDAAIYLINQATFE